MKSILIKLTVLLLMVSCSFDKAELKPEVNLKNHLIISQSDTLLNQLSRELKAQFTRVSIADSANFNEKKDLIQDFRNIDMATDRILAFLEYRKEYQDFEKLKEFFGKNFSREIVRYDSTITKCSISIRSPEIIKKYDLNFYIESEDLCDLRTRELMTSIKIWELTTLSSILTKCQGITWSHSSHVEEINEK